MNLLDHYLAIEATSQKMLVSAQGGLWDEVVECEAVCSLIISKLRLQSEAESLTPEARKVKTRINFVFNKYFGFSLIFFYIL